MAIDFPPTPALGEIYTYNGRSWQWNGTAWDVYSPAGGLTQYVSKLNGLSGSINIAAGTSISVTPTGNTLTIAYTGTGGGGNTGATGATGATGPQGNTGATGATGSTPTNYVASFNGLTGAVTGVNSIRGLTGTIGITNGSGITLSVSGQTLTISHLVTNEDTNATRYIGFYGSTSGTDTPRTDIGLIYNPFTQTISGVGGLVLSGITSGAFSENSIRLYDSGSILITSNDGNVNFTTPGAVGGDVASLSLLSQDGLENGFTAKIVPQAYYSGARTFTLPDDSGTVALTKNVVSSFNGLTGAVTGVTTGTANTFGPLQSFTNGISASGATFSGLIRANAGISASGITVGGTLQGTTANFTGLVSSTVGFSGSGTNLTNVAKTNVANTFTNRQTISGAFVDLLVENTIFGVSAYYTANNISVYTGTASSQTLSFSTTNPPNSVSLPSYTTVLAGLAGTQTFTGTNTFTALSNFNAGISAAGGVTFSGNVAMTSTSSYTGLASFAGGISASGGTFSGNIRLQNAEYIQNTTNGRIDLMPAPTGSTQFGMYFDMTSWGYGAQIGTIRSSDGALNSGGNILWNVPLIVATDTNFAFGGDSQFRFGRTSTGLDTLQSGLYCDGVNNSGAFALVALSDQGISTRSPATAHTTPNFYIYANSTIRNNANDFIRFEHNTINGRIVSGGTSGINIEPGSGVVGISGGMCASGMVVLAQGVCGGYGNDVQSYGYTSGYDIIPTNWQSISANISASPDINSIYLAPINISKKSIIKSIATQRGTDTTGNTGNFYLGLYNSNLYGLPNTLVYSSPSTVLGTGNFGVNRVSNVNYTANPGAYWIGIVFSAAGLSAGLARYGGTPSKLVTSISSSPVAQSTVTGLTAATSGFTLPTNLNNVSVTNVIGNNFPAVFFTAEGAT